MTRPRPLCYEVNTVMISSLITLTRWVLFENSEKSTRYHLLSMFFCTVVFVCFIVPFCSHRFYPTLDDVASTSLDAFQRWKVYLNLSRQNNGFSLFLLKKGNFCFVFHSLISCINMEKNRNAFVSYYFQQQVSYYYYYFFFCNKDSASNLHNNPFWLTMHVYVLESKHGNLILFAPYKRWSK